MRNIQNITPTLHTNPANGKTSNPIRFGESLPVGGNPARPAERELGDRDINRYWARESLLRDKSLEGIQKYGAHPDAIPLYLAEALHIGQPATIENILDYAESPDASKHVDAWLEKALAASPRAQALETFLADETIRERYVAALPLKKMSPVRKAFAIQHLSDLKARYEAMSAQGSLDESAQITLGKSFYDNLAFYGLEPGGEWNLRAEHTPHRERLSEDDAMIRHLCTGLNSFDETERHLTAFLLLQDLMSRLPEPEATPLPVTKSWHA